MMASAREQQETELHELQQANDERRREYRPGEVHQELDATNAAGDDSKKVEVHAFGGHVHINSHGEARFDLDSSHALEQAIRAARTAVS